MLLVPRRLCQNIRTPAAIYIRATKNVGKKSEKKKRQNTGVIPILAGGHFFNVPFQTVVRHQMDLPPVSSAHRQ
jgi:hypothetical protein